MAVFGPVPGFIRSSILVEDIVPDRAVRPAARLLQKTARDVASHAEDDVAGWGTSAWREAYVAVGLGAEILPPHVALRQWARSDRGVPSQGPLLDLVHATSLRYRLPAAAYDLDEVQGDMWLRPSRGTEWFEPIQGRPENASINELVLADSGEKCLARAWHGAQTKVVMPGPGARRAIVHIDRIDGDLGAARDAADAVARLLEGFLDARATVQIIDRSRPRIHWPA